MPTSNFGLTASQTQAIKSIFKRYRALKKVLIFGSRAKNTFHKRSDIDLVFLTDKQHGQHELVADLLFDWEELDIPYRFDVKAYHNLNYLPLKKHIDEYGKIFYEVI